MPDPTTFGPETARKLYELTKKTESVKSVSKIIREEPVETQLQIVKVGKANEPIMPDSFGSVSIWRQNSSNVLVDTDEDLDVWLDVAHSDQQISAGKWVFIGHYQDENIWRIFGAECEDPDSPNIFQAINENQADTFTATWTEPGGMVLEYSSGTAIVLTEP